MNRDDELLAAEMELWGDTPTEAFAALLAEYQARRKQRRLREVICPQCEKPFELRWSGTEPVKPTTLSIRGCPSGGIYDVSIECPHCNYVEAL